MGLGSLKRMEVAVDFSPVCPRDEWLQRFLASFGESQSCLSEEEKFNFASDAFPNANDIEPEIAAEVFAEILLNARVPVGELSHWLR